MVNIACVGIAVQDRIYRLESLPESGGKYQSSHYLESGGGPAATAAVAVARLGGAVDFIGRVGRDSCGETLLAELQQWGVNIGDCRRYDAAHSSQSAILVDNAGERIIVNYPSPDLPTDAHWLENIDFSFYDLVLADVRWHEGALKAFQLARAAGVPTLLDADVTPQNIVPLVELASHAVFSTPGLQRMTQETDLRDGLKKAASVTDGQVYVTQGNEGTLWLNGARFCHVPAFKVDVVDTTGAGDVFHGAISVALAEQQTAEQAIRFASAVAALKCTRPGGRSGIPDREQTASFLSLFR